MTSLDGLSFLVDKISVGADVFVVVLRGVEQVLKLVSFTGDFPLELLLLIAVFVKSGFLSDQIDVDIVLLFEACLSLLGVLS
jgi:hypothetical protein